MKNNQITVLIGSCDNYSVLWSNFDVLFKRYWKLTTTNIIVSETIIFDDSLYVTFAPGKAQWGERLLGSLELVRTEYVFLILDDYFLTESFSEDFINEHIALLEKYKADKIMCDINYGEPVYSLQHIDNQLYRFKQNSLYLNSVQPAIWKTSYLKKILKPNYSPWDFELEGNLHTKQLNHHILINVRPTHMYFNFVRKGGILSEGWEKLCNKENLNINFKGATKYIC